jgi:uncharacterized protein
MFRPYTRGLPRSAIDNSCNEDVRSDPSCLYIFLMSLKPSFYNLFFQVDHKQVLFNSFRGNLVEVTNELKHAIEKNDLNSIPEEIQLDLKELGFVVDEFYNETRDYLEKYEQSKNGNGELSLKIFMATSCNLSCPYCYQSAPSKPGNVIQKKQIDTLLKWFDWECTNNQITKLSIEFFGGEPLLARLLFPSFIKGINRVAQCHSAIVEYSIVTNGTLFDDILIDLFVKNRVSMQISLDGEEVSHDKRRAWKSTGKGSFRQIFSNLKRICETGGADLITIRMNVDKHNLAEISALAQKVRSLGIRSFSCGRIHFREKKTDYDSNLIPSESFDHDFDMDIFRILQPLGFATAPSKLEPIHTCLFHWRRGYAVSPSLNLFKCDELIDHQEFCVGHITDVGIPEIHVSEYEKAVSRKPSDFEDCILCKYLPQCGSGCPIRALNSKGSLQQNFCEATYDSIMTRVSSYFRADNQGLILEQAHSNSPDRSCG